ncbi:uncharacterized protein LOC143026645 isoform X2 [Oratosquilla oratoria]|uniref:uncharacterized protein LOC143026645 isoform X2 n=1 Tax=Oratosquilla oratoria TaxID=337810 RepID=UPI003F766E70
MKDLPLSRSSPSFISRAEKMKTFVAVLFVALVAMVLAEPEPESEPHRHYSSYSNRRPFQTYNTLPSNYNTAHFPNFLPGHGIFTYRPQPSRWGCKYWCKSGGYSGRYYCCSHLHNRW